MGIQRSGSRMQRCIEAKMQSLLQKVGSLEDKRVSCLHETNSNDGNSHSEPDNFWGRRIHIKFYRDPSDSKNCCPQDDAKILSETNCSHFTAHSSLKRKAAFTLAEVLITLGIIGVVAALTMPSVINNTRNAELESRFKKTYSDFSNALQKASFDLGESIYGNYSGNTNPTIGAVIVSQFSGNAKSSKDCLKFCESIGYKTYSGSDYNCRYLDDDLMLINDNYYIFINTDNDSKTNIQFIIDTNGIKKPNKEGYDLFTFCLQSGDKLGFCENTPFESSAEYTKQALNYPKYFKKLP